MRGRKLKLKRTDKALAQQKHAKKRALERYGLDVTHAVRTKVIGDIKKGRARHIEKQSGRISTWQVCIDDTWYPVVYDKSRIEIVTFLPIKYLDRLKVKRVERKNKVAKKVAEPIIPVEKECVERTFKVMCVNPGALYNFLNRPKKIKNDLAGLLATVRIGDHEPANYNLIEEQPKRCISFDVEGSYPVRACDIERMIETCTEIIDRYDNKRFVVLCYDPATNKYNPRSLALAYIFWSVYYGKGEEVKAFRGMRSLHKKAVPCKRIIELADDILQREGLMLAELNKDIEDEGSGQSRIHLDRRDKSDSEIEVEDKDCTSNSGQVKRAGEVGSPVYIPRRIPRVGFRWFLYKTERWRKLRLGIKAS